MKFTLKIAMSILIITGIVMIIVGATNEIKTLGGNVKSVITDYIAVGVLMLALGLAGFIAVSAIGQPNELDTKNADQPITPIEENSDKEQTP